MADSKKVERVDLTTFPLQHLQQLKMQIEAGLNVLQGSFQTLYKCKEKYAMSKEAIEQINEDWKEKQILVPLTSSMYVPGTVKEIDTFIVNIGTGYYAEKNLKESKDYFERKINFVQEQMETINNLQMQKTHSLSAVHHAMEFKMGANAQ